MHRLERIGMIVAQVPRYAYSSNRHEAFSAPPGLTTIWRYMTLPKLLVLLESKKLFFCRASKLDDPFEGAIPKRVEADLRAWEKALGMSRESIEGFHAQRALARSAVAINCWHMSEHESAAMWALYGLTGEGVAVKSSVARLSRALPQRRVEEHEPAGSEAIYVGRVKYIDYATAKFSPAQTYLPYVHKRESFKHENELRAVAMISEAVEEAAASGTLGDVELSPGGLSIPVAVETLIESLYVAPTAQGWFEHIVRSTVERFGFGTIPVVQSPMAESPIY